jgi:hypothetical protein
MCRSLKNSYPVESAPSSVNSFTVFLRFYIEYVPQCVAQQVERQHQ